jgi:WD40 repeat protein
LRRECGRSGGSAAAAPPPTVYAPPPDWRVCAAVLKLHSRRITALEWHPRRSTLLVSGDKRGQLAFWDSQLVTERTVLEHGDAHQWLVSALRFLPQHADAVFSSSVDGTVCRTCCETMQHERVGTLNPGAVWSEDEGQDWRSIYAMEADPGRGCLHVGDDLGVITQLDPRAHCAVGRMQAAKAKTKLCSLALSVGQPHLLASAGNDHVARVWDLRMLGAAPPPVGSAAANKSLSSALLTLLHPRVVSAVAWSPLSGRKLMTTCTDNRLRVWSARHAAAWRRWVLTHCPCSTRTRGRVGGGRRADCPQPRLQPLFVSVQGGVGREGSDGEPRRHWALHKRGPRWRGAAPDRLYQRLLRAPGQSYDRPERDDHMPCCCGARLS